MQERNAIYDFLSRKQCRLFSEAENVKIRVRDVHKLIDEVGPCLRGFNSGVSVTNPSH